MLACLEHAALWCSVCNGCAVDHIEESLVGVGSFLATLEYCAVAALDAQRRYLHKCVWPCFEYNTDDTDRAGDSLKDQPLVKLSLELDLSNRIRKLYELIDSICHVSELVLVKLQSLLD